MHFLCPSCKAVQSARDEWAGATTTCRKCGLAVTVPLASNAHGPTVLYDTTGQQIQTAAVPPHPPWREQPTTTSHYRQVACPHCAQAVSVTGANVGRANLCPLCGGQFQLPDEGAAVAVVPPPPPPSSPQPPQPELSFRDVLAPRQRRPSGFPVAAILVTLLFGMMAGGGIIWWLAAKRKLPSPEGSQTPPRSETWNHAELIAHLRKKGLKFLDVPTARGSAHGPVVYLIEDMDADRKILLDEFAVGGGDWSVWKGVALVQLRKTPQDAKDAAGPYGQLGFFWGRFLFAGDPDFLVRIRKAL